jgi:hypothetical protein
VHAGPRWTYVLAAAALLVGAATAFALLRTAPAPAAVGDEPAT